jgi:NAD(P)-dependent dehydrogenase (short-subunit alcohol dehydrogenase family)
MPNAAAISPPGFDLSGRVAMVSGASSGLGARFARLLAASGAKVVAAARRKDRLEALVSDIQATGRQAVAVSLDVESETSIIAAFDAAEAAFGPVSTLINNAGINSRGLAVDLPVEELDKVLSVNVRGVYLMAREAARRALALEGASDRLRIVNIASIGGLKVLPGLAAYCTSKAAVVMLTRSLAREWAKNGIAVNAICPGYVETEINAEWLKEAGGQRMVQGFPRRRLMRDQDLDQPLLMLAGEGAGFITGAVLTIDDGQSL